MKRKCSVCKLPAVRITPAGKGWCGGEDCGTRLALLTLEKSREAKAKKDRAEHRERKDRAKTRAQWLAEAQKEFNAYIRARDAGKPCVSCGAIHAAQWDAGHYRSVGAAAHLRFNEDNVHRQCSRPCNKDKSGNLIQYRIGLVARIGIARVEALERDNAVVRLTIDDIKAIKAKYAAMRKAVTWSDCHIDHIDNDVTNNARENLRQTCRWCNTSRGRGPECEYDGKSKITIDGVSMTAAEWARQPGVNVCGHTILSRKARGASDFDAVFGEKKTHNGKAYRDTRASAVRKANREQRGMVACD